MGSVAGRDFSVADLDRARRAGCLFVESRVSEFVARESSVNQYPNWRGDNLGDGNFVLVLRTGRWIVSRGWMFGVLVSGDG